MNALHAEFFGNGPPATSAFEATRLPLGASAEIEAIVAFGQGDG